MARIALLLGLLLASATMSCGSNVEVLRLVSIMVIPKATSMQIGEAQQYTAIAVYSDGSVADVTQDVLWESSDPSFASVNEAGLVTATANGATIITATLNGLSHSVRVQVGAQAKELVSISVVPRNASIKVGETQQYAAIASYSDGSTADITGQVTWASSDQLAATIDAAGLATANANGAAIITATFNSLSHSVLIQVGAQTKELVSISVVPRNASIKVGATQQYAATASYSEGSTADVTSDVTWSSSNSLVATINAAGLATANGEGNATITATLGSKSDSVGIVVVAPAVAPPIPASHASFTFDQCASCHAIGAGGAPVWPEGHPPDPNCTLAGCHQRA